MFPVSVPVSSFTYSSSSNIRSSSNPPPNTSLPSTLLPRSSASPGVFSRLPRRRGNSTLLPLVCRSSLLRSAFLSVLTWLVGSETVFPRRGTCGRCVSGVSLVSNTE
uniref:Uncharacterized protein n=1 Tax=Cacopsylla melanoneura TaxID=428564 RepID=A0A8D8PSL5_9HEMI